MASAFRTFSAKEPLSSRSEIHRLDAGLSGVPGAQEVIKMMSSKRTVTKLLLGHNQLGDDGCLVLFTFLGSQIGRRYPIAEISLNSNRIGNQGLLSMCQYISGNKTLKELFIQANSFTGDSHVVSTFVKALNTSRIETLSITSNIALGDAFAATFFPELNCPSLQEFHMSSIGLTPRSVSHIASFIRSPDRCCISTLKCNGNSLGWKGLRSIARAAEHNYTLAGMEFHANRLISHDLTEYQSEGEEEHAAQTSSGMTEEALITATTLKISRIGIRNAMTRRETEQQALELLRYARTLLLHKSLQGAHRTQSPLPDDVHAFRFSDLPIELQLTILSQMAPSLSPRQKLRIFHYAADPSTLPPLLARLPGLSSGCLPDPGVIGFGRVWPVDGAQGQQCGTGECMGTRNTVSCSIEISRSQWLALVGCNRYDPQ